MQCPKCNAEMEKVTHENIEVDRCTECKGIWFDLLEAEKLKKLAGSEAVDNGDVATGEENDKIDRIECPKCKTPMIRMSDVQQPHIHYESCTVCYGNYFDAGEFKDYKEHTLLERIKKIIG